MTPLLHLNPPESANIPKHHASPAGTRAHSLELCKLFCALFCLRDVDVFLLVVVEVTRVSWSSALWQERSFDLREEEKHSTLGPWFFTGWTLAKGNRFDASTKLCKSATSCCIFASNIKCKEKSTTLQFLLSLKYVPGFLFRCVTLLFWKFMFVDSATIKD